MSLISSNFRQTLWDGAKRGRSTAAASRLWYYLFMNEFFDGEEFIISPEPMPPKIVTVAESKIQGEITYSSVTNGIFHLFVVQYRKFRISQELIKLLEDQAFEAASDILAVRGCAKVNVATIIGTKIRCWHLERDGEFLSPSYGDNGSRGDIKDYIEINSSFAPIVKVSFEIMKQQAPGIYPSTAVFNTVPEENSPPPADLQPATTLPWLPPLQAPLQPNMQPPFQPQFQAQAQPPLLPQLQPPFHLQSFPQQMFLAVQNQLNPTEAQDRWLHDVNTGSYVNLAAASSPVLAAMVAEDPEDPEDMTLQEFYSEM